MNMGAEIGMLIVETIAKIRRAFFVQGKPIKAICRELRISRKVVRKVLRSEATEFRYEREAQPLPKIGPWRDKLNELLLANEGKASRERLTLIRLFEELREDPRVSPGRSFDWLRMGGFLKRSSLLNMPVSFIASCRQICTASVSG